MKVVVTSMPSTPRDCVFGKYDLPYDVVECMLSKYQSYECNYVAECPYLEVVKKEEED